MHTARSLLSCALWRGMGRLWRGMGGMGDPSRCFPVHDCSPLFTIVRHCSAKNITPEPVSPLRPHRQDSDKPLPPINAAGKVFTNHETRDKNHGLYAFHQTRDTAFFRIMAFFRVGRPLMREGGRSAGFKGGCTKRCVNEWKGVFLNPERKITTFSESRFGSRFGIPHYSSEFVGKIRISPCRQSSVPRALWQPGYHESRLLCFSRCFPAGCGAAWDGMGRLWRGMGDMLAVPASCLRLVRALTAETHDRAKTACGRSPNDGRSLPFLQGFHEWRGTTAVPRAGNTAGKVFTAFFVCSGRRVVRNAACCKGARGRLGGG